MMATLERQCEMCDDVMGMMSKQAWVAAHGHCELCAGECERCQEEMSYEGAPPYDAATATGMYDREF